MSLTELFCHVDDFCQQFIPVWQREQLSSGKQRRRAGNLCLSEIMTILIHFHQSHYPFFEPLISLSLCVTFLNFLTADKLTG
jgi:hypothetical protein